MALTEGMLDFASATAISSTTADVVSTNVYNAGSATKLFAGGMRMKIKGRVVLSAGTNPTVRARLVGADNAGLTTNPIILADTGIHSLAEDGSTALVSVDTVYFTLAPQNQREPKQYYGVVFTLGGTVPSGTGVAKGVLDAATP